MRAVKDYILVGASTSIADRRLIQRKLDVYLAGASTEPVVLLNDARGIFSEYFGEAVVESRQLPMSLVEKRRLVRDAKWVLLFWDGTTVSDFVYLSSLYAKRAKVVSVATTRVVNKERGEEFDVYIGRGTPWGNPFAIGDEGLGRPEVIAMYQEYFQKKFVDDPEGNRAIRSLKGKVLGCHCKPAACHGDVIAAYLNSLEDDLQ